MRPMPTRANPNALFIEVMSCMLEVMVSPQMEGDTFVRLKFHRIDARMGFTAKGLLLLNLTTSIEVHVECKATLQTLDTPGAMFLRRGAFRLASAILDTQDLAESLSKFKKMQPLLMSKITLQTLISGAMFFCCCGGQSAGVRQ